MSSMSSSWLVFMFGKTNGEREGNRKMTILESFVHFFRGCEGETIGYGRVKFPEKPNSKKKLTEFKHKQLVGKCRICGNPFVKWQFPKRKNPVSIL